MLTRFDSDIYVDSLAAVTALNSSGVKSKCLNDCMQSLTLISYQQVELIWVPGHRDVRGNAKAKECAVHVLFWTRMWRAMNS